MRVLGDHLHTSLLGHLHDGCVPLLPKGFRVILKGQAGHPPFLWGERICNAHHCWGEGSWAGTQLPAERKPSTSGDLSEQTGENNLNQKANRLRAMRFEEGRPLRTGQQPTTVEPEASGPCGIRKEVGSSGRCRHPCGRRMQQEAINTRSQGSPLSQKEAQDRHLPPAQQAFPRAPQGPANFWPSFLGRLGRCEVSSQFPRQHS